MVPAPVTTTSFPNKLSNRKIGCKQTVMGSINAALSNGREPILTKFLLGTRRYSPNAP